MLPAAVPPGPVRRLEVPPYDLVAALALERELSISHTLAQILVRRGFGQPAAARAFLAAEDAHDPGEFAGIGEALTMIGHHVEPVADHRPGDYDVDGVCATAILVRALRSLGADVGWFLPSRLDDGYGVSSATIAAPRRTRHRAADHRRLRDHRRRGGRGARRRPGST